MGYYSYSSKIIQKNLKILSNDKFVYNNKNILKFCHNFRRQYIVSNFYNFSILMAFERGFFPEIMHGIVYQRIQYERIKDFKLMHSNWY